MNIVQPIVKVPESSAVIRFQDCDPFGHLNNARYMDYFFNAREDHLVKHYDFHIFEWGKTNNASWVVSQNQLAYLRPAMVMEDVIIRTALIQLSDSVITFEGLMYDSGKHRLKAILWSELTYVSLGTGRKTPHPAEIMDFFGTVLFDEPDVQQGFPLRVQTLRELARTTINTTAISA